MQTFRRWILEADALMSGMLKVEALTQDHRQQISFSPEETLALQQFNFDGLAWRGMQVPTDLLTTEQRRTLLSLMPSDPMPDFLRKQFWKDGCWNDVSHWSALKKIALPFAEQKADHISLLLRGSVGQACLCYLPSLPSLNEDFDQYAKTWKELFCLDSLLDAQAISIIDVWHP